jgi:serine protease Do
MNTGIGFAIPINMAREISEQIIETGKFTRARLGIGIETLVENDDFNRFLPAVSQGVIVSSVDPQGPAAGTGLQPADVVVAVGGVQVATSQQLKNQVRSRSIGEPVVLSVVRMNQQLEITVTPEEWESKAVARTASVKKESRGPFVSGLRLRPLTEELVELFGLDQNEGLVITEIERDSLASRAIWLRPGVLVTAVNSVPVKSLSDVSKAWADVDLEEGVLINLIDPNGVPRFEFLKGRGY